MQVKKCEQCNTPINPSSKQYANKKFCSDSCRDKNYRQRKAQEKRLEKRQRNIKVNGAFRYIADACLRAGTVEILSGHTVESLAKTISLIDNKPKSDVHICHIAPVKGENIIGKLHHENLFYGGSYQNRVFGNRWLSGGRYIHRRRLNEKWLVHKGMKHAEILDLVELYLGCILIQYLKQYPVRKSQKESKIDGILKIPGHDYNKEFLQGFSSKGLEELRSELNGKGFYSIKITEKPSKYIDYTKELERFSKIHKDNRSNYFLFLHKIMLIGYAALEKVCLRTRSANLYEVYGTKAKKYQHLKMKDNKQWSEFKDYLYEVAYLSLQGKVFKVADIQASLRYYTTFRSSKALESVTEGMN